MSIPTTIFRIPFALAFYFPHWFYWFQGYFGLLGLFFISIFPPPPWWLLMLFAWWFLLQPSHLCIFGYNFFSSPYAAFWYFSQIILVSFFPTLFFSFLISPAFLIVLEFLRGNIDLFFSQLLLHNFLVLSAALCPVECPKKEVYYSKPSLFNRLGKASHWLFWANFPSRFVDMLFIIRRFFFVPVLLSQIF